MCESSTSGVREKHQDWEALLEKALAEECSAPASLLELVRQGKEAAVLPKGYSHPGWGVSFWHFGTHPCQQQSPLSGQIYGTHCALPCVISLKCQIIYKLHPLTLDGQLRNCGYIREGMLKIELPGMWRDGGRWSAVITDKGSSREEILSQYLTYLWK